MHIPNLFIYVIPCILLNSCTSAYVPNTINTPLFNEKGEIQVAIHSGTSGLDPQLSYAITNHIGLQLNGNYFMNASNVSGKIFDHYYAEIAPGYYSKINSIFRFETYGGFGLGKMEVERENELWDVNTDINLNRIFIQSSIGLTNDIVDTSFTTRFAVVNLNQNSVKRTGLFIEPVLTTKVGYKYVKAVFQFGFSFDLDTNNIYFRNSQPLLLSIGIQINPHKIFNL
ncbi:hypothetical protein SAMN04487910_0975 [Aquimarina amphilecti]|uniref:Outer membrane protein beta-barrel domain-containing protein n=2 Tax=Aquimarina amphilecti TaxID=1038014 RepID=A0A1H7JFX3_AQUAM|nr:hypothetical protein SAMN04487910_0975 [Aquimarina amphilecti]